jgi:F0F1-type ATP synthase membrane subunit b/b'
MTTGQQTADNVKTSAAKAAFMLPRKLFFDDMPDKGLFAGTAALGFALIIILKVGAVGPELIAGLAVALMFTYGFIAYRIPAVHLRLDRLGDNFYYLGFIYTLASLSAALVQLRNGVEIDSVLGNFGIALITTIVGIAGRVVFVQMRSEIDDVEEVIRRDILEASAALKGQLSAALNDLDTFRTGLRQIAKETLEESVEYGKAHVHQIGAVAQQAADRINAAFEERQSHAQEVLGLVLKISKATDKLLGRIESADLPTEQVVQRLNGFTSALETFLDRLRRSVQEVLDLSDARLRKSRWRFWAR